VTKYLLDVNALVAFGVIDHAFHTRVIRWIQSNNSAVFASCSITELGFVRVVSQTPIYGLTVSEARNELLRIKQLPELTWEFLADAQDISQLPTWVKTGGQTTDGHLVQLAAAHEALLATFDSKIPGAFLIP
jgi:predicted nucleic acid-binding protein